MSELTPVTRIESYLDAIVDGGTPPLEDVTRIETFLDCIYNNQVCNLTPVTRIETYLAKISGASVTLPDAPVTRIEMYLASIAGEDVEIPDAPVTRIEEWLEEWANGANIPWETLSGAIVSFITQRAHALKQVVVDINPVQSGSGDPSPDNVRPISGWTGANVTRTGKNLIDPAKRYNYQANTHRWYTTDGFVLKANQTYTLSSYPATAQVYFLVASGDATLATGFAKCTYTPTEDTIVCFQLYSSSGASGFELQLELGSTASDYEAYAGNTYTIDWTDEAGTVYGGTLTVNEDGSGEVKVTKKEIDLGTMTWITAGSGRHSANNPVGIKTVENAGVVNALCSQYIAVRGGDIQNTDMSLGMVNSAQIQVNDTRLNGIDADDFKTAMNGVKMVYELATPVTYQLTAQQVISALQGYNAIWADTGDITVTFRGTPIVEPDEQPLQALNLLLGGAYHNAQTQDDVSDEEALDILLGGETR